MTEEKQYVIEKEKQSCNDPDFLEFIERFKKEDSFWISIREITGNKEWDKDTPPLAFTLTFNTTAFIRLEDELNELYNENEELKQQLIEKERMLDVRDKIIEDVMKAVNGDVE